MAASWRLLYHAMGRFDQVLRGNNAGDVARGGNLLKPRGVVDFFVANPFVDAQPNERLELRFGPGVVHPLQMRANDSVVRITFIEQHRLLLALSHKMELVVEQAHIWPHGRESVRNVRRMI